MAADVTKRFESAILVFRSCVDSGTVRLWLNESVQTPARTVTPAQLPRAASVATRSRNRRSAGPELPLFGIHNPNLQCFLNTAVQHLAAICRVTGNSHLFDEVVPRIMSGLSNAKSNAQRARVLCQTGLQGASLNPTQQNDYAEVPNPNPKP